jgi:hypothetical protein
MNRTRKKWLMFFVGWAFVLALTAQESPVPVAPYLARAPEFSAWKVLPQKAPATAPDEGLQLLSRELTKTAKIRREVSTFSDQSQKVVWIVGPACYKRFTPEGWSKLDPRAGQRVRDYSKSDFPELDFVRLANFKKVEAKNGRLCFLYEASVADLTAAAAKAAREGAPSLSGPSGAKAWIDVTSQLPVAYQEGNETWVYTFLPAPSGMLPLPAEIKILAEMDLRPGKER